MIAVAQVAAGSSLAREFRRPAPWWAITFRKDGDDSPEGFERVDTKGDFSGMTLYKRPEVEVSNFLLISENVAGFIEERKRQGFFVIRPFRDSLGKNQMLWFHRDKGSGPGIPFAKDERFRVRTEYAQGVPPDSQSKRFKHQRLEVFFPEGTAVTMVENQGVGFESLASIEARAKAEGWETAPELQGHGWTLFFRSEAHPHGWVPIQEKLVTDTEEKHAAPPVEVVSVIPVAVVEPVPPIHSEPDDSCGAPRRDGKPCRNPKGCQIAPHVAWRQSKNPTNDAADDTGGKGTLMSIQDPADDTGGNSNDAIAAAIGKLAKGLKKIRKGQDALTTAVTQQGDRTTKAVEESAEATKARQDTLAAAVNNANRQPVPQRHWAAGPAWALVGVLAMIALAVLFYQLLKDDEPSTSVDDIVAAQVAPVQDDLGQVLANQDEILANQEANQDEIIALLRDTYGSKIDEAIAVLTQYGATIGELQAWLDAEAAYGFTNNGDCNVFIGVNVDGEVLRSVHASAPWGFVQCGDDNSIGTDSPDGGDGGCNCGGGPAATTTTQPAGTTTTSQPPGATTTTQPPANNPPTAEASGPGTKALPESTPQSVEVCLSGSGSHDNDESGASIVSYQWTSAQGLGTQSGASVCYTITDADVYTWTLTVTDDEGTPDTDDVTVSVVEPHHN